MKNRLKVLTLIITTLLLFVVINCIGFAKFPDKPITIICQFSAGGTTDLSLRVLANFASGELGVPVNVVNKAGGGGVIAYGYLAKTEPDGYTLGGFSGGACAIAPRLSKVDFDTKNDFDFIIKYAEYFLSSGVRADSPWENLDDLIKYAKEHPGEIKYGSSGVNSSTFFTTEALAYKAGIDITHVPFKGGSAAATALLGGHIDMITCAEVAELAKSGQLRMLIQYGDVKHKDFPDVPTAKDLGFDLGLNSSLGIAGPKGIPEDRIQILHDAFKNALEQPAFIKLLDRLSMIPSYSNGEEFEKTIFEYYDQIGILMKELKIIE